MTQSTEHILLNEDTNVPAQTTAIILGVSEPAADKVATVLRSAGVPVRADSKGRLFARRLSFPTGWLEKKGVPLDRLFKRSAVKALIETENAENPRWVLRDPAVVDFLANGGLTQFRAPRLIVLTRDPIAVAEGLSPPGSPFMKRLRQATDCIDLILKVSLKARCPVLLLSHADVMRADAGFSSVVRAFCGLEGGLDDMSGEATAVIPDRSQATDGLVAVSPATRRKEMSVTKTIVVGGPPRSGTSMVAAALYAGGLPLGDNLLPSTFENALHNALFRPQVEKKNWKAALKRPRYFSLVRDGFDIEAIKKLVADRRGDGAIWGFKRPGIHDFITDGGLRLLENPSVIMSFRDPLPMAKRIAQAHGLDISVGLAWARREIVASLVTACACDVPTFLISYEVARRDFPAFLEPLYGFCGLQVDRARYAEIAAFAEESGEKYLKQFAAPSVGEIRALVNGVLRGWVSRRAQGESVVVDIFADSKKVASAVADRDKGHGRLGFRCRLDRKPLADSARITAFVAATKVELDYSGLTVRELRLGQTRLANPAATEVAENIP